MFILFFFSSRRRHTRWPRDWSSDVCSSDLLTLFLLQCLHHRFLAAGLRQMTWSLPHHAYLISPRFAMESTPARSKRSEERRVGKECRVEWWWYFYRIIYNDVY